MQILILILLSLFLFSSPVHAGRPLPRFSKPATGGRVATSSQFAASVRLRGDRRALNVYFNGLNKVQNVTYILTYKTNGIEQGAQGTADNTSGAAASRELLFGTCSSGVCTYHSNLTDMKLEVTASYPSGKQTTRRYKIRV